jgi:glycyl-tRNA synthetase
MLTFQEMLLRLARYWEQQGCVVHQGYDLEVGAGTFNPATFLRGLGPEPYRSVYFEPCRRPSDGRYGSNPNRVQHYFQGQVTMKPAPANIIDLYLKSLEAVGFDLSQHDMRFVHDDWESPTLGAWGLGWEVWMDGMEITQFTYFQSLAGISLKPITVEITYGLERLALYLQRKDSIFDLQYNDTLSYGDVYFNNEVEWSHHNFETADTEMWSRHFCDYENEARRLIQARLPIPAYDFVLKASHAFNLLDARGVISVTERTGYIARIRALACEVASLHIQRRQELGFPLLQRSWPQFQGLPNAEKGSLNMPTALCGHDENLADDFVLEIGSEELPATFVPIGIANLKRALAQLLDKEGIAYRSIETDGTPRRLVAYVAGLAHGKPPQRIERRGPAIAQAFDSQGQLSAAGRGFLRSIGKGDIDLQALSDGKVADMAITHVKGADYLVVQVELPGRATSEVLQHGLPGLIAGLEFPKKMHWGDFDLTYARPIRWVVSLFGKHVVPFQVGDVVAGRQSWGHRQRCPVAITLDGASSYYDLLRTHLVMVKMEERKAAIEKGLNSLEAEVDGHVIARDQVMPQVINLVEWPEVTVAQFDPAFLKIPKEVLVSEMVEHQKYFPVAQHTGELKNSFIITADTLPTDYIRHGNQKVLSARLSDGAFLYEQGLKVPLQYYNEKLKQVTFQKELGSTYDKVLRIGMHASYLQELLQLSSKPLVARAAEICKADLASEMVFEFPDLQGTIGRYYAQAQGEDPEVAQAIEEQWMPRRENAPLPASPTGIVISLADKLDNLIGCFAVNLKPTSSSDPYALRRQVLAVIKMAIAVGRSFSLRNILVHCATHFSSVKAVTPDLIDEMVAFVMNRMKTVLLDYGFNKDEIDAALCGSEDDLYDAFRKVEALHAFREEEAFEPLCEVYKRAKGQLQAATIQPLEPSLLSAPSEIALYELLNDSEDSFSQAIAIKNYREAYKSIAKLQPALARLFDEVKILDDHPAVQANRLALLHKVFGRFAPLVDFGKLKQPDSQRVA